MHFISKHLEHPAAYARLLFLDFSLALKPVQPYLLVGKLNELNIHPLIIKWYHSFLTSRKQTISVLDILSANQTLNTGAPKGCVCSPVLFTLYTNECRSHTTNNCINKLTDDTAISSLMKKDSDISEFHSELGFFFFLVHGTMTITCFWMSERQRRWSLSPGEWVTIDLWLSMTKPSHRLPLLNILVFSLMARWPWARTFLKHFEVSALF